MNYDNYEFYETTSRSYWTCAICNKKIEKGTKYMRAKNCSMRYGDGIRMHIECYNKVKQ